MYWTYAQGKLEDYKRTPDDDDDDEEEDLFAFRRYILGCECRLIL